MWNNVALLAQHSIYALLSCGHMHYILMHCIYNNKE